MVSGKNLMRHQNHLKKIQNIITDKLGIESDVEIYRYHRIGSRKTNTGQDRDRQPTIVCRPNRFKDKQRISNNSKKNPEKHGHLYT